tara:strand:+ start:56 stop:616 length:561 start_codon:yes stop_codon:yes gene_type:complete
MKITVGRLKTIIQEELNELKLKRGESSYKRDEGEESPKEELGSEAHAESAEQTDIILGDLKKVLEKWEEGEYESDESRWQEYAKDIQGMIDQLDGEEEHDCDCDHEDHAPHDCDCEHSEKSHEEREGEEESPKPKKKSKPKEKKEKGEESSTPKKAGKSGGKNFPYESKKLEQMIYQKLITAFGEE